MPIFPVPLAPSDIRLDGVVSTSPPPRIDTATVRSPTVMSAFPVISTWQVPVLQAARSVPLRAVSGCFGFAAMSRGTHDGARS
ncbi:hypothetical protein FXN61_09715 [Lentzea sp. PSKA42]|uniref:Uncharacterized protein n=1 Tax=Lentzea indica TaxID=2604800 RepID=A0ABX1FEA3_9PSEU|nr:hypothetical protein [Lentzea indica]NKE57095.1 hypothetical protein [Lentzea indica]